MVDAQAPGLARMVRALGEVAHAGPGWESALIDRIGRLHLLIQAYRRIDRLDEDLAADVRSLVGFTTRREVVLERPAVTDRWWILGRRLELQDNLHTGRAWLYGQQCRRFALVLTFAAGSQPFDPGPAPGTRIDADLHFYPGAVPLRAVISRSRRIGGRGAPGPAPGREPLSSAWDRYTEALLRLPWLERFPMALTGVAPVHRDGRLELHDGTSALPAAPFGQDGLLLLAVSGGAPIDVFGEWNGARFVPLACHSAEGFVVLGRNPLYAEVLR